ncbi:MAG: MarR family winged helix-turn-helix transcriptional regulator [Caulobacteraceae bacterium]
MHKLPLMPKMGVIFLSWRRSLQKNLVPHKITLKQEYVLNQLLKKDFLYPSQIADMLFCDRPTCTVIIKNMEREKWIRREKDIENAKQVRIYITEQGKEKIVSLKSALSSKGEENLDPLACLSEEEKEQLDLILSKVLSYLKVKEGNK